MPSRSTPPPPPPSSGGKGPRPANPRNLALYATERTTGIIQVKEAGVEMPTYIPRGCGAGQQASKRPDLTRWVMVNPSSSPSPPRERYHNLLIPGSLPSPLPPVRYGALSIQFTSSQFLEENNTQEYDEYYPGLMQGPELARSACSCCGRSRWLTLPCPGNR